MKQFDMTADWVSPTHQTQKMFLMWKNISDETKALNSFLTFDIDPDSLMVDGITIC